MLRKKRPSDSISGKLQWKRREKKYNDKIYELKKQSSMCVPWVEYFRFSLFPIVSHRSHKKFPLQLQIIGLGNYTRLFPTLCFKCLPPSCHHVDFMPRISLCLDLDGLHDIDFAYFQDETFWISPWKLMSFHERGHINCHPFINSKVAYRPLNMDQYNSY